MRVISAREALGTVLADVADPRARKRSLIVVVKSDPAIAEGAPEPILLGAKRMTDIMSRTGLSIAAAVRPCNQPALAAAARTCANCGECRRCDGWIVAHADGAEATIPCFCPIKTFLRSLNPRQAEHVVIDTDSGTTT